MRHREITNTQVLTAFMNVVADERGRMRLDEVAKTRSEFVAEPRKQQPDLAAEVTTQRQIESGMAITEFALSAISVPTVRRVHFVSEFLAGPPLPLAVPTASRPQDAQKLVHAFIDSPQQHLLFRLDCIDVFAEIADDGFEEFVDRLVEGLHERVAQGIDFGPQLGNFLFAIAGHAASIYE